MRATREAADCLANLIAKRMRGLPPNRDRARARGVLRRDILPGGPCKNEPSRIEDDVLMKVIEQTLRLDMVPIEAQGR